MIHQIYHLGDILSLGYCPNYALEGYNCRLLHYLTCQSSLRWHWVREQVLVLQKLMKLWTNSNRSILFIVNKCWPTFWPLIWTKVWLDNAVYCTVQCISLLRYVISLLCACILLFSTLTLKKCEVLHYLCECHRCSSW